MTMPTITIWENLERIPDPFLEDQLSIFTLEEEEQVEHHQRKVRDSNYILFYSLGLCGKFVFYQLKLKQRYVRLVGSLS